MESKVFIIEQITATELIVQCARCKGSGRVWPGDSDSDPCWTCSGKGQVLISVERLPLIECARCKGSGRKWPGDSDSKECVSCGGIGCQPIAGEWKIIR